MTVKKIRDLGFDIYKKNENSNWILGLACGLLIGGSFAIAIAFPILLIIILPFLVAPIFFASHVAFLAIQANQKITLKSAVQYFLSYFKNPYNSSFSFTKSFLISLLVYLFLFVIFTPISYGITNAINPVGLSSLINELDALLKTGSYTIEQINIIFNKYADVVMLFTYVILLPASFLTLFVFSYFITKNSCSVYYRLSCPIVDVNLLNLVQRYFATKNKKEFLKFYFGLNWPLYLTLTIGFGCGIAVAITQNLNAVIAATLSCALGLCATGFYLPFYFPNMQAMFEYLSPKYQEATNDMTNRIINNIKAHQETVELKQDNDTQSEIVDIDINKDDNNPE